MLALQTLMQVEAHPNVVREAQGLVELVLKGMLRWVGIDPPKWHYVGTILLEHRGKFPPDLQSELPDLANISRRLRRDREIAICGEIDLIPEQMLDRSAAQLAMADAQRVLLALRHFPDIGWNG